MQVGSWPGHSRASATSKSIICVVLGFLPNAFIFTEFSKEVSAGVYGAVPFGVLRVFELGDDVSDNFKNTMLPHLLQSLRHFGSISQRLNDSLDHTWGRTVLVQG